nr:FecR domain-containing protein [uncultured Duganella sp.]
MQRAAEWFALLRSGDATEKDRAALRDWLDQAGDHRQAWAYAESISQRFATMQGADNRQAAAGALTQIHSARAGRRRLLGSIAVLAGGGWLGWASWRDGGWSETALAWSAGHRTATGEMRDLTLADGTRVWLNTATALNTDYQPAMRRVQLVSGEMLIDTGHDARPFFAETRHGRLQALGTRFTVRLEGDTTLLAVYQGKVAVTTRSGASRVVEAGKQLYFSADSIQPVMTADPAREAWTRGVLLAADIPLQDLVAELRRYHRGHLGVAPEVAQLRVLGGYPLHDPQRALAMLEGVLPIKVQRTLLWWISIEPK